MKRLWHLGLEEVLSDREYVMLLRFILFVYFSCSCHIFFFFPPLSREPVLLGLNDLALIRRIIDDWATTPGCSAKAKKKKLKSFDNLEITECLTSFIYLCIYLFFRCVCAWEVVAWSKICFTALEGRAVLRCPELRKPNRHSDGEVTLQQKKTTTNKTQQ